MKKIGVLLLCIMTVGAAQAGSEVRTSPDATPEQGGMKVYVDPQTGNIVPAPAPGASTLVIPSDQQNALSTSSQGLAERPSDAAGGGVLLDLQGRFQSPMIGTTDNAGNSTVQHLGGSTGSHKH